MSISFDKVADIYDDTRGFPTNVMNEILKTLEKELDVRDRTLDVGVGTGRFAKPLQDAGFNVVGIDISDKMLEKAQGKGARNLIKGDIRALPFRNKEFGVTISVHALHLIKEWEIALREITRTTKDSLITIARNAPDYEKTPSGFYKDKIMKRGYSYEHPGIGEWVMKEKIEPTRTMFITSYKGDVEKSINFLNDKVYSFQWNAPEDSHEKVMKELRKRFRGVKEYVNNIYLYEWDIYKIKIYLKKRIAWVGKEVVSNYS